MEKRDAILTADHWIELLIKSQPQLITPNLALNADSGATVAQCLLDLRKKLIEGLQTQD